MNECMNAYIGINPWLYMFSPVVRTMIYAMYMFHGLESDSPKYLNPFPFLPFTAFI